MNVTGNNPCQAVAAGLIRFAAGMLATGMVTAADVTPLDELPDVSRIWIAMEEGSVRPAAFNQYRSEAEGPLLILKSQGDLLKRGDVWAVIDPQLIDIERRSLELDEKNIARQMEKIREDAEDARRRVLLDAREIEGKIDALKLTVDGPDFPSSLRAGTLDAIGEMKERLELMHQRASRKAVDEEIQAESDELAIQLERKRRQFEQMERRARLTAISDGELRFSPPLIEKIRERESETDPVLVSAGELLATIIDEARLEIVIQASGASVAEVPAAELAVFLQDGRTGRLIRGNHLRTEEAEAGSDIIRTQYFEVVDDDLPAARQAMGNRNLIHVYRMFSSPKKLVHKDQITFLAPDILEQTGWAGLVRHLWPGARVAHIGPQTIALEPANAP